MTGRAVDWISAAARERAESPFLVDALGGRDHTYGSFDRAARALAAELRGRGLEPGERLAVLLPNCVEYPILYVACMYAGVSCVPLNPALSDRELGHVLSDSGAALVVAAPSLESRVPRDARVLRLLPAHAEGEGAPDALLLADLPDAAPTNPADGPVDVPAAIMYTSGTTARPKGVAHSAESLVRNAEAFAEAAGLDGSCRFHADLPMAYMAGFLNLVLLPFVTGGSTVVAHAFDARSTIDFWSVPEAHGVDSMWLTPTILAMLLRADRGTAGERFCRERLRFPFVGTAPLAAALRAAFEDRYGVDLLESYGLSETLFVSVQRDASVAGTVGPPLRGVRIAAFSDGGDALAAGEEGEIHVRTPDLMLGYSSGALGVTPAEARDGWFATGDLGVVDDADELRITGRKKDLVIRGGVNVSPQAIEEVIAEHESVEEVAVVGAPHDLYGEDVVAVVRLVSGVSPEEAEGALASYARERLAAHQQPSRYLAIDEMPTSVTGKVQKARLREFVANRLRSERPGGRGA